MTFRVPDFLRRQDEPISLPQTIRILSAIPNQQLRDEKEKGKA